MQRNRDHMWRIAPIMSGCLLLAAAFCMAAGGDELRTLETSAVTVDRLGFDLQKVDGHAWLRLQMPLSHQIACYGELIDSDGTVLGFFYADGLHDEPGGTTIAPGESSAWVDLSQFIDGETDHFILRGLFGDGQSIGGWGVVLNSFEGQAPPPSISEIMHLQAWPEAVHGNAKKYIRPPYTPHQDWIDAMAIMQPWYDIYAEEMILKRDEWIPRLRDDMGMDAIIFIPAPGDIAPNYDMQVYKDAIADYHAAGMKVLMYWSIMHIGHHDAWHEAAKAHPEWAQRDADGNPVTVYGDLWMCPNTGALDFCIDLGIKLMVEMDCDGIMLDNNEFFMTDAKLPTGCCEGCQAAFAEWVKNNITAPELKALGHAGDVSCPRRGEPLYKHWIEWRYETWAEATEKFRQAVRKAKPEAILTANTQYMGGWSLAVHGQFNSVDCIFTENKNRFGPNMAMTLKYARSLAPDIPIWNYIGAWEQSSRSHLRPAGMIEDQICATYASASSLWLTGYGFVPKSNISHWLAINYSTPADHSKAAIDPYTAATGQRSVRIETAGVPRASIAQDPYPTVESNEQYRLSAMIREEGVTKGRARLRITFMDVRNKVCAAQPYAYYVDAPGGTHDWNEIARDDIVAPPDARYANVEAFMWATAGTVWVDEMSLVRVGSSKNLLQNPGFELDDDAAQIASKNAAERCLQFAKANREYFRGLKPFNNVAILASRASTDHGGASRTPQSTMLSLLRAHIGYDVIADEDLSATGLRAYDVLLLESATCLDDAAITAIAEWVRKGGKLICSGPCATLDGLGNPAPARRFQRALAKTATEMQQGVNVGRGHILWMRDTAAKMLEERDARFIGELAQIVVDMGGGLVQVEDALATMHVEAFSQSASHRVVLMLNNQGVKPHESSATLRVPVPTGWGRNVRILNLDGDMVGVHAEEIPGGIKISIPPIRRFAIVIVE